MGIPHSLDLNRIMNEGVPQRPFNQMQSGQGVGWLMEDVKEMNHKNIMDIHIKFVF